MTGPGPRPETPSDSPDARGGIVRTGRIVGEMIGCGPSPISADTVRTRPDTASPDSDRGVRFAYKARVPRHLMGAAFAEGLALLAEATQPPADTEGNSTP